MLDMALRVGTPPAALLDPDAPQVWSELDLEVCAQWKRLTSEACPGCGRPVSQHLHNPELGREERPEDYSAWSLECPAMQAIASGQSQWRTARKASIDAFHRGTGSDPSIGTYWVATGAGQQPYS